MRKLTSVLLVLVLLFSFGFSASANMTEEQFVDFMSAMEFVDSKSYESASLVTRAQFADFLTKVIGVSSESTEKNLNALYAAGAIDRENNGDFRAEDKLTCAEATKAMMVIAGYGEAAQYRGGYMAYAAKCGIQCGKGKNSALTWGDVMELLYQTLRLYQMESTYGAEPKYSINTDKNVMGDLLEVEESRGVLSACGNTDLYSSRKFAEDRIVIGGVEHVGDAALYKDYIGYRVTVFYKQKADEKEIVFLYPEARNKVFVLEAEDILGYQSKEYEYDEDGKTERYSLADDAVILYNGKLPMGASFDFVPENGWVELIDHNGDGDSDVVKIYSYQNYYVELTQEDADGLLIYSKSKEPVLVASESNTWDDTLLMQADGSPLKRKALKKGGLVSVFGTVSDGVLVAERLYYTSNAAEGVVDSYDAGEAVLTINGTEYSFCNDLQADVESLAVGSYRNFLLDFSGKLAYLYPENGSEYNQGIGYLVAMDTASGAFEDYMDVKIFNSAGRMEIYSSTDKIVIDGTLYKGTDKVIKALKAAEQKGLVAYTLNNDKTLRSLDYPEAKAYGDMSARDALNHMVSLGGTTSKVKYRTSHNIFGGNIPCHDNTKMFIVPSFAAAEDEDYSISTPKEYCRDDGTFENIYGYAFQNSSLYADFIVYLVPDKTVTSLSTGDYELAYAIKSIRKQLNASGDAVTAIEAVGPNGTETFELKTDSAFSGYEVGDVVRFATDTRGKVVSLQSVYDRSAKTFNDSLDSTSINCAFRAMTGRLFDRQNDNVLVAKEGKDLAQTSIALTYDSFNALKCDTAKIVLVKKDSGGKATVKSGSKDDLKAYTTHADDCATVVASTRVGVCNLIVIFE